METHNEAVSHIAQTAKRLSENKIPLRIYHGSTNSTRETVFDRDRVIDASALSHVLSVNTTTKTALVEPNVPMDKLVEATLHYGLLPPVVMEFPGITAGGGFVGTAGESSSFKHGFFDRTVLSFEMVLANGEVVQASKDTHPDLFEGAAGSFGTLGVLTLLELQLIDAAPYVEVTYTSTDSIPNTLSSIEAATKDPQNDYVDGILYSRTSGLIVTGKLTHQAPSSFSPLQRFSRARDPWFFTHGQTILQSHTKSKNTTTTSTKETVPITDYLFRYNRGAFWMGWHGFRYFLLPFDWLSRLIFNPFMNTRIMYRAFNASGLIKRYIVQDLLMPLSSAPSFIDYIDSTLSIYPLWLCPFRHDGMSSMGHPRQPEPEPLPNATPQNTTSDTQELLLNIGVWGDAPHNPQEFIKANRDLEHKVRSVGGLKWLYATTYYSEEEFWSIYDGEKCDSLRNKYHASALPTIYDKVKVDLSYLTPGPPTSLRERVRRWVLGVRPLAGYYGVYKAVADRHHLLSKKEAGEKKKQ